MVKLHVAAESVRQELHREQVFLKKEELGQDEYSDARLTPYIADHFRGDGNTENV